MDFPWHVWFDNWAHIYFIVGFFANFSFLILRKRLWRIVVISIQLIIAILILDDYQPYRGLLTFCIALLWFIMGWLLTHLARAKLESRENDKQDINKAERILMYKILSRLLIAIIITVFQAVVCYWLYIAILNMYISIGGWIRRDLNWGLWLHDWAHIYFIVGFFANFSFLILRKRWRHIVIISIQLIIAILILDDYHPYRGLLIFCIALLWIIMGWLLTHLARTKLESRENDKQDINKAERILIYKILSRLLIAIMITVFQAVACYFLYYTIGNTYIAIHGPIRGDIFRGITSYYWAHIQVVTGFIESFLLLILTVPVANFLLLILKKRLWRIVIIGIQTIVAFAIFIPYIGYPYRSLLAFLVALTWIIMGWLLTYFARTKLESR